MPVTSTRHVFSTAFALLMLLAAAGGCGSVNGDTAPGAGTVQYSSWDHVLMAHVDPEGFVDYGAAVRDSAFEDFIGTIYGAAPSTMPTRAEQLAFWINAYNALTFKLVGEHLPISSITDIAGGLTGVVIPGVKSPWELTVARIEGHDVTLQEIEDDYVRNLGDERVHFAINCASISCPRLQRSAFTAANLEELLNTARREFLADRRNNYIRNGRLYLSKIFDWYRDDFEKNGGTLQAYLARHWPNAAEATMIEHLADDRIEFLDYNWRLISPANKGGR